MISRKLLFLFLVPVILYADVPAGKWRKYSFDMYHFSFESPFPLEQMNEKNTKDDSFVECTSKTYSDFRIGVGTNKSNKADLETTANGSLKIIYSNTKKYQNLKYKNYRLKWAGDDAMITIGTFVNTETKKNMVIKMMNIKKGVAWWVIFAECIGGNPELDRMAGLVIQSIHILK